MKRFYEFFNYNNENIATATYKDENANWYDFYDIYIKSGKVPSYFELDDGEITDLVCSDMGWNIFSKELMNIFINNNAELSFLPVDIKGVEKEFFVAYYNMSYLKNILNDERTIWGDFDENFGQHVVKPVININECEKFNVLNLDLRSDNGRMSISENIKNDIEKAGLVGIIFEETASV